MVIARRTHPHVFEDKDHSLFETRTWFVMVLTFCSMILEIVCGILFGSLALVADGLHMGTHCLAFFLSASSYSYSRKHSNDKTFVFGTGKVTELASYTSGLILLVVAGIIIYEAISRLYNPHAIYFWEALPIAFIGLCVNIASGFILMCRCQRGAEGAEEVEMSHGHSHGHVKEYYQVDNDELEEATTHPAHDETYNIQTPDGILVLSIFEEGIPPEFRIDFKNWKGKVPLVSTVGVTTLREDGRKQNFEFTRLNAASNGTYRSTVNIPEPHQFRATVSYLNAAGVNVVNSMEFVESDDHSHGHHGHGHEHDRDHRDQHDDNYHSEVHDSGKNSKFHRDNNYRAAICHVVADAFVSVLVIIALCVIKSVGPTVNFLDPTIAMVGAGVIISWSYTLIRDTGVNLLDKVPDQHLVDSLMIKLEASDGTVVHDLHVWRLGPGHLGAIVSLTATNKSFNKEYFLRKIRGFKALSHVTFDIDHEEDQIV